MKNNKRYFLVIFLIMCIFYSFNKAVSIIMADKDNSISSTKKNKNKPTNNSAMSRSTEFVQIPVDPKVQLGKKLFFDPLLSKDDTVSCATCHKPGHAFSDDKPVSLGINGQKGDRNTPTVFNTAHLKYLFWDGRAESLEEQALGPIQNPKEMGEKIGNVLLKLNNHPQYKIEFASVFMQTPISTSQIIHAIAAYERILISYNSDYDRYISGDKKALTLQAKRGMDLFFGKAMCAECHKGPDFTDGDFHNIGLPITDDVGRARITVTSLDTRKFKTPTLREIERTAPYFHNGQFETIEQVIAFYNAGGGEDGYKDPLKKPLNLSLQEQKDLVQFLKSLNGRQ